MSDDLVGLGKIAEAAERGTREFRELVRNLLNPAVNELGEYFANSIRLYRAKAAKKAVTLAKEQIERSGLEQQPLTVKDAVLLLEGASLEEDDYLISKWAGLISSAATGGKSLPAFADILRQLSPEEAKMLDFIADHAIEIHVGVGQVGVEKPMLKQFCGLTDPQFIIRVQNLHRLEVIVQITTDGLEPVRGAMDWGPLGQVGLTALGEAFVQACRGPVKSV
jgi:hypothetical protein